MIVPALATAKFVTPHCIGPEPFTSFNGLPLKFLVAHASGPHLLSGASSKACPVKIGDCVSLPSLRLVLSISGENTGISTMAPGLFAYCCPLLPVCTISPDPP
mgnify:CR=1 FL=1